MELERLPPEVISILGEHLVGVVEPAGLRGVSVITREIAQMAQSSKLFHTLVASSWITLSDQTPALFHQFGINDVLEKHGYLHFLGQPRIQGPVNFVNFVSRDFETLSPGLQALGSLEKKMLKHALSKTDGPFAVPVPLRAGFKGVRAPLQVKLTMAVEKCQRAWGIPSPLWTTLECNGTRQLESIDMVRELITECPDRGLVLDEELSSLISRNDWPHWQHGSYTWWGFRKLICDRWSPAEVHQRQQARRKAANICLHCLCPADPRCVQSCCPACCSALRLTCWLHNPEALWRGYGAQLKRASRKRIAAAQGPKR